MVTFTHPTPLTASAVRASSASDAAKTTPDAANPLRPQTAENDGSAVPSIRTTLSGSDGSPPQERVITTPSYPLSSIDPASAEQVAYAYLTWLMSYSYRDSDPGKHMREASRYAVPSPSGPPPVPHTRPGDDAVWAHLVSGQTVSTVIVNEMYVDPSVKPKPGSTRQTVVRLTYTRILSDRLNAAVRTSGATTVTLQQQPSRAWLVTEDGFGTPN